MLETGLRFASYIGIGIENGAVGGACGTPRSVGIECSGVRGVGSIY